MQRMPRHPDRRPFRPVEPGQHPATRPTPSRRWSRQGLPTGSDAHGPSSLQAAADAPAWAGSSRHNESRSRPVLLVDDDEYGRDILRQILSDDGFEVLTAANGEEAMARLHGIPRPGLIVLDLLMPRLDGWQFALRQQKDPRLADIPIIVVSATDSSVAPRELEGIVARFEKPVVVGELLDAIREHIPTPAR